MLRPTLPPELEENPLKKGPQVLIKNVNGQVVITPIRETNGNNTHMNGNNGMTGKQLQQPQQQQQQQQQQGNNRFEPDVNNDDLSKYLVCRPPKAYKIYVYETGVI